MKVVSTDALTKLIQLVKSAFIKVDDVVEVTEIETEIPSEITLATVATSGNYDDLSNKPTIPSAVTETTVSGWGFTKNTGTVISVNDVSPVNGNVALSIPTVPTNISAFTNDSGYITSSALTGYEQTSNKVTSISSSSTDTQYPSAKCVYDIVGDIETVLHTINSGSSDVNLSWWISGEQPAACSVTVNNTEVIGWTGWTSTIPTTETLIDSYSSESSVTISVGYSGKVTFNYIKLYLNGTLVKTETARNDINLTHTFTLTEDTVMKIEAV